VAIRFHIYNEQRPRQRGATTKTKECSHERKHHPPDPQRIHRNRAERERPDLGQVLVRQPVADPRRHPAGPAQRRHGAGQDPRDVGGPARTGRACRSGPHPRGACRHWRPGGQQRPDAPGRHPAPRPLQQRIRPRGLLLAGARETGWRDHLPGGAGIPAHFHRHGHAAPAPPDRRGPARPGQHPGPLLPRLEQPRRLNHGQLHQPAVRAEAEDRDGRARRPAGGHRGHRRGGGVGGVETATARKREHNQTPEVPASSTLPAFSLL